MSLTPEPTDDELDRAGLSRRAGPERPPCFTCKAPAGLLSHAFETAMCSIECEQAMSREWAESLNRVPLPEEV